MPRGGAHFAGEELAEVLSHYDIGVIYRITPLSAGSIRAPKTVIISERGKFLLKRRPKGKDSLCHVAFAHAVQSHLARNGLPVAMLAATRDTNNTVLQLDHHIYELFEFVSGVRYDGSAEATTDSGRQLGMLHRCLADFGSQWRPPQAGFHNSSTVRRHLKITGAEKGGSGERELRRVAEILACLYDASSARVNDLGFNSWAEQVVHGDWHPGNMLFAGRKLIAVFDFDSARTAPAATDLANGILQFSIVGDRPNPADWPAYLDQGRLVQFLSGYREVVWPAEDHLAALPDLMIETMIAEAILPVAATGFFGNLSGLDFLTMIQRKSEWIDKHRGRLLEAVRA